MNNEHKNFIFGEKKLDELNSNINLRAIGARADQWEHPIYGMFHMNTELKKVGGDILKTSKRVREIYALSIVAMAMQYNYGQDWWINMLESEDFDGLIMTFLEVTNGGQKGLKGLIRKTEVVEHRSEDGEVYDTLLKKISETAYEPDTILVCLVLTPGIKNLQALSERLKKTSSTFKHVFLVFSGVGIGDLTLSRESLLYSYCFAQLLPEFVSASFDYRILLKDFNEKYKNGKEVRGIEGNKIVFRTRNKRIVPGKD